LGPGAVAGADGRQQVRQDAPFSNGAYGPRRLASCPRLPL